MAETAPQSNNKAIVFEGSPKRNAKADALRKRGLISDRQAEKRGLDKPKKGPADGEMANLLAAS